MAAGFVKLEPASGKVTGTHSNMPLLVVPSAIANVGSLTLAEAQSARFYTDEAKTTELAREVVGADEIHVKVSSVSSTTDIWMDWDGVRSDYAVTDTYGRNAVWSGYVFVSHLGDVDATGNNTSITNNGSVVPGDVAGPFGNATSFNGSTQNFVINSPTGFATGNGAYTLSAWGYPTVVNSAYFTMEWGATNRATLRSGAGLFVGNYPTSGAVRLIRRGDDPGAVGQAVATTWQHFAAVYNPNVAKVYRNGSAFFTSGTLSNGAITLNRARLASNTNDGERWAGRLREWRATTTALSDDWISTEYQNQNDNGAFWVATPVTTASPRNALFFGGGI